MEMSNETDKAFDTEGFATSDRPDTSSPQNQGPEDLVMAEPTPEQVEEWRQKAGKADEHWDRLVRVSADFDNYKKRAARERQDALRYANESLLQKLVPILDNLEMALNATGTTASSGGDALKTGVNMIFNQLRSVLAEAGIEEIDATGQKFDPNWHEAVSQQASTDVPEGQVLQQIRKGYKFKDRLIRPASVVVAKKPAA